MKPLSNMENRCKSYEPIQQILMTDFQWHNKHIKQKLNHGQDVIGMAPSRTIQLNRVIEHQLCLN